MEWDCEWWLRLSSPWMRKCLWKVVSSLLCPTSRASVEHCRLGFWWCWTWVIQNGSYWQYKEKSGPGDDGCNGDSEDDGCNWRMMGITGEGHWSTTKYWPISQLFSQLFRHTSCDLTMCASIFVSPEEQQLDLSYEVFAIVLFLQCSYFFCTIFPSSPFWYLGLIKRVPVKVIRCTILW